ncbi:MAG: hypothetical protein Q7R49_06705 [Candidatus Daviesbacteria bacterium]|nr:hypothetical protein [Candidatus Daviesbacteria bacterium]
MNKTPEKGSELLYFPGAKTPLDRFPMVRKVKEVLGVIGTKVLDVPTGIVPKLIDKPFLGAAGLATVFDEGTEVYGLFTQNLHLAAYSIGNLLFSDLSLIIAGMNLYSSSQMESKFDRLSRVASLGEGAMAVAGSYMLRTGDFETGARLLVGNLVLQTPHMVINFVRMAEYNRGSNTSPAWTPARVV